MKYLFMFFSISFYGQVLHHQMISSQGTTTKTSNGTLVRQTIGQLSRSGNYDSDQITVGQGFQQSIWQKYMAANKAEGLSNILTYPNPFVDVVNFKFPETIVDVVSIYIFDINGRVVFHKDSQINGPLLTVDLAFLPRSNYLVSLKSKKFIYYTQILKNL
ncbi:hypothetical protein CXF59_02400 [Flavobacterium sp. ALD4]|uniref:T9SS type A sorting domain-containing protein n=1 Tax=Flavobacterium sp. ALD4 TaxID=2058314 RepID=UPI000C326A62|nr:T9SS type A sorting domain-containing protein [Flavobacterium sp. ALD4]PKH69130.1 hypothetical protein CXF59_02400 [Flavobacterium sp. ALD4]